MQVRVQLFKSRPRNLMSISYLRGDFTPMFLGPTRDFFPARRSGLQYAFSEPFWFLRRSRFWAIGRDAPPDT